MALGAFSGERALVAVAAVSVIAASLPTLPILVAVWSDRVESGATRAVGWAGAGALSGVFFLPLWDSNVVLFASALVASIGTVHLIGAAISHRRLVFDRFGIPIGAATGISGALLGLDMPAEVLLTTLGFFAYGLSVSVAAFTWIAASPSVSNPAE